MSQEYDPGKLFVGGLSWDTTDATLRQYFEKYGELVLEESVIMRDPSSQNPRGFGFVKFVDPAMATQVLNDKPHTVDGKIVDTKPAQLKSSGGSQQGLYTKKVFVGGLPSGVVEGDLKAYFENEIGMGNVVEVELKFDRVTNKMRGFGFVTFLSEDIAQKVCDKHFYELENKTFECKKADPKSMRQGTHAGVTAMGGSGGGAYQGARRMYHTPQDWSGAYGYGYQGQQQYYDGRQYPGYEGYGSHSTATSHQMGGGYQDSYSGYSSSRSDPSYSTPQAYHPQYYQQPQQHQYGGAPQTGHSGYGGRSGQQQQPDYSGSYGHGMPHSAN